jgi:DNA-binding transcriptional MerR regulator
MPPQRRPLAPLNNDRIRNNELGIHRRGQIEGLRNIGLPMATISRVLDIPKSSVQYTIGLSPQRLNGASISRSGRPKIIDERTKAHRIRPI